MRRVEHKMVVCAAMFLTLACSSTSAPTSQSTDTQATTPAVGSSAGATAEQSGGRPAGPTIRPPVSFAGRAAPPSDPVGQAASAAGSSGMAAAAPSGGAGSPAMASADAGSAAPAAGAPGAAAAGMGGAAGGGMASGAFILTPIDFPMAGAELTFPQTANPPTNQSPEFTWTGVPAEAKTLALAFRDLGNSAVKWIIWDMPPSLTHIPPNVEPVAMPSEVPGSSQLGSLSNQGYAGPGMGARQYDFTLWALDTDKLPVTARMTTVQIHELLEMHEVAKTPPVLVRNTRNL